MNRQSSFPIVVQLVGSLVLVMVAGTPLMAQATPATPPGGTTESGSDNDWNGAESSVGYIDNAIPTNQLRLRFDAAYDDKHPTRADFIYPGRGGLPEPETRIDYQEISTYLEATLTQRLSAFVETPVRFINPEINPDHAGFSDMNAGMKWAFLYEPDRVLSFQLRTYAPTGDAHLGLGNNHVSLEPAFLLHQRLTDCLNLDGELRYWIPIEGSDFAGDIIRYGIGLSYGRPRPDSLWITPVAEVVGWTLLGGKERVVLAGEPPAINDVTGSTIVNLKVGARVGWGNGADLYAGFGQALTGDQWYRDILRLEFRLFF
jgi:hypothetical protein